MRNTINGISNIFASVDFDCWKLVLVGSKTQGPEVHRYGCGRTTFHVAIYMESMPLKSRLSKSLASVFFKAGRPTRSFFDK